MDNLLFAAFAALWLGILTSISPCPLATNIAAISFIGRRFEDPRGVFFVGLLYTAGRTATYLLLGIILMTGLMTSSELSLWLQKYMNKLLGPILILVGMFLLELIQIKSTGIGIGGRFQQRAETYGVWGAGLLGVIFALSFCPLSAALFFGSLISLALKQNSAVLLPSLYGIGTGLPVLAFAVIIAFGAKSVGKAFDVLTRMERWVRRITGIIFILVGLYYTLTYIFRIL